MPNFSRPPGHFLERPWPPDNMEVFLAGAGADKAPPQTLVLGQPATIIGVQKTLSIGQAVFPTPSGSFASALAGFGLQPNSILYGTNPAPQVVAQQEQGVLQASSADQTSRLYTVTISSRGYPQTPRTGIGTGFGSVLRAHMIWASGQAQSDIWFDCTNGAVISVGASTIQVSVALLPPVGGQTYLPANVGMFIAEGQRTLTKPLRLTETYLIAANALNFGPFNITIPPFATDVLINRLDIVGTLMAPSTAYVFALSDWLGPNLINQSVASNVSMTSPVTIPGNASVLTLYGSAPVPSANQQVFTISWGLTI